jgi:hypothetical protein
LEGEFDVDDNRQQCEAWVRRVLGIDAFGASPGAGKAPDQTVQIADIHNRIMLCASQVMDEIDLLEPILAQVVVDHEPLLRAVTQRIVDLHERIGTSVSEAAQSSDGAKIRAQVAALEAEAFKDPCLAGVRAIAEAAGDYLHIDEELAMMFDDVSSMAGRLSA